MRRDSSVNIDISEVTETDLTFIQLIESARRSAIESGRSVRLRQPAGGAVLQVLRRGGFLEGDDPGRSDFWLQGTSEQ